MRVKGSTLGSANAAMAGWLSGPQFLILHFANAIQVSTSSTYNRIIGSSDAALILWLLRHGYSPFSFRHTLVRISRLPPLPFPPFALVPLFVITAPIFSVTRRMCLPLALSSHSRLRFIAATVSTRVRRVGVGGRVIFG